LTSLNNIESELNYVLFNILHSKNSFSVETLNYKYSFLSFQLQIYHL
jgi:hypothetical protein